MIVCCPEKIERSKNWKVFLAGPIQGAPEWQFTLPEVPGITWLSPRRKSYEKFDWNEQFDWETKMLRSSDIVLFWIPEEKESIPGRDYAQTTRTEIGEYLALGKKIFFGCYSGWPGERYILEKLKDYNQSSVPGRSLEDLIERVDTYINSGEEPKIFFTSDTHFGSLRTLELSRRPFKSINEMDWTTIRKWNNLVRPCDIVYHLGDFGESWPTRYLNGEIHLIFGNYERDGKSPIPPGVILEGDSCKVGDLTLVHEPLKHSGKTLFGHIHGRQKVKSWSGLDVGVDGNNFQPVSLEEAEFFLGAVEKGYYDSEVWS